MSVISITASELKELLNKVYFEGQISNKDLKNNFVDNVLESLNSKCIIDKTKSGYYVQGCSKSTYVTGSPTVVDFNQFTFEVPLTEQQSSSEYWTNLRRLAGL